MSNIISNHNYLNPTRYISGRIIEYDIKAANISCLRDANEITEEDYIYLKNLPKIQREIEIGLREKHNPKLYTIIQNKIKEAKIWLYETNKIEDNQIVRVANDAVYINNIYDLQYTKYSDYIEFIPKSVNNIYLSINGVIIFLYFANGKVTVDIKGISEDKLVNSYNYFISEVISIILLAENSGIKDAINYLCEFIEHYLKRELSIEYYRELYTGKYKICNFTINKNYFLIDNITENDKYNIDINYNYNFLRELFSILIEKYNIIQ